MAKIKNSDFTESVNPVYINLNVHVRRTVRCTRMEPSAPALIEISRLTYSELLIYGYNLNETLLPEYFDYYATAMLWFRILSLKIKLRQPVTEKEIAVELYLRNSTFFIPEPILEYLEMLGAVETIVNNFHPHFPSLPTQVIAGHGGYYGPLSTDTHNLYEEIPCLGVLSEAVRQSVSEASPGPYVSSLAQPNLVPNKNLLGFRPLEVRTLQAKKMHYVTRITEDEFPEHPANTGINFNFIRGISNILSQYSPKFNVSEMNITSLSKSGSAIQTIIQKEALGTPNKTQEKQGELFVTSLISQPGMLMGAALMHCPQLWKTADTLTTANKWACVQSPPQSWINNRNIRRLTLPETFLTEVFKTCSYNAKECRNDIVRRMLIRKKEK